MSVESMELVTFADNDLVLYRQKILPVMKNLSKKYVAGIYDHDLAVKLWKYVADAAAKRYCSEYGYGYDMRWNKVFSVADRNEAARKMADDWLDEMKGGQFEGLTDKSGKARKNNPVPLSTKANDVEKARLLYEKFTGHDGIDEVVIDKPVIPDVLSVIGDVDGIMYTTVRDGKTEKYLHKFKKSARPLFCVSPDGLSLHLIGGSYQFGERGIVDT